MKFLLYNLSTDDQFQLCGTGSLYFKIFSSISATISQICLGVQGKSVLSSFDGLYDMEEQAQLREDCAALVGQCVCVCVVCMCACVCACVHA